MRCIGTEVCEERCIEACPKNALEYGPIGKNSQTQEPIQLVHVKRDLCDNCGECAKVCHPHALYIYGQEYTVEEIMKKVRADKSFFEFSGGGVTISGGEAMSQPAFTLALLKQLKEEGFHTALDTTGFTQWESIEKTLPYTDLYLYDLKNMDSEAHKLVTGVPNDQLGIEFYPETGKAYLNYYENIYNEETGNWVSSVPHTKEISYTGSVTAPSGTFSYTYDAESTTGTTLRAQVKLGLSGAVISNPDGWVAPEVDMGEATLDITLR